jgi:hypothetical protein
MVSSSFVRFSGVHDRLLKGRVLLHEKCVEHTGNQDALWFDALRKKMNTHTYSERVVLFV